MHLRNKLDFLKATMFEYRQRKKRMIKYLEQPNLDHSTVELYQKSIMDITKTISQIEKDMIEIQGTLALLGVG